MTEFKKNRSKYVVGLFATSLVALPLAGCADADAGGEVDYCYDTNSDLLCDDDGSAVDLDSYVVIDGQKVGYIRYDDDSSGGSSS